MGKKKIVTTVVAAFFGLAGGAWAQGQTQDQAQTQQQKQQERQQQTQISHQQVQAKCIQAKRNLQQAQLQQQQANANLQALQRQSTAGKQQLQQAQEQVRKANHCVHVAQRELRRSEQDLNQLRAQQQRLQEQQQQRTAQLQRQQQEKAQAKARACDALKQVATVRQEARGTVVSLAAPLLFKFDEASLMPTAEKQLDAVANALKAAQEPIVIEGFTDSVGTQAYNEKLSNERAQSVRDYLIQQGVPPQQIQGTEGLGEQHPVASNDTSTGRANNRRVEIVLPNFGQGQGTAVGGAGQAGGPTQQNPQANPSQKGEPSSPHQQGAGPANQESQPPMQNQ